MARIASFDLGTSALKCVVLDEKQNIYYRGKAPIRTYSENGRVEQDAYEWWSAFVSLSHEFDASLVDSIIFSGQMQDLIFLDKLGETLTRAVLYTDQRGRDFVSSIPPSISDETSVDMDGSIPLAKILWFRRNQPDILSRTEHILISAKDYLIFRLTGNAVSDVTSMSTSGMMNILTKEYADLSGLVDRSILPEIMYADEVAGTVSDAASAMTGYRSGVEVFAGCGDAAATTLASGIAGIDEVSINLGTSGWVASLSDRPIPGVFNLASIERGSYIAVIPVLNAANVHAWVSRMLFPAGEKGYENLHEILVRDKHANPSLLCLPYLAGERFPVSDDKIRGAFIGLDQNTESSDIARSALEGVAFSLRLCLERLSIKPKLITLIGGGAGESVWNQIFADVLKAPSVAFPDSDILPVIALSAAVLLHHGIISSYQGFVDDMLGKMDASRFITQRGKSVHYDDLFERFRRIYPAVKNLS